MPVTVVLAVGIDSWLLSTHSSLWKSHGYVVISVNSVREAIDHFKAGDFDLVLLGNSITSENRERLTFLIRACGSRTPVVCVTDSSAALESFADAAFKNEPASLLSSLRDLLAAKETLRVRPAAV